MLYRSILSLALCVFFPAAQAQPSARGDDAIVAMGQAFKQGDKRRLSQLLPLTRGHALEPWAAYWELRARLDEASAGEIQEFLTRWSGTYQEDRLRNDWLLQLGARRDWNTFAAEYPRYRMNDDRTVRCYAVLIDALRGTATQAQADEVRRIWFAQREETDGCTNAADKLIDRKLMTAGDAWRKARIAVEANRPQSARAAVEIVGPDSLKLLDELMASPAKFLGDKRAAIRRERKEIITLALVKLAAGGDAENTAALLENKWGMQLTPEERNWVWGVLGRQSAGRLGTDALDYYGKVTRNADLSDEMLQWKARAALRSRQPQWRTVAESIAAMGDEARRDPTWIYWRARATAASGASDAQKAEARQLFESIASARGFYEQLALEELGQKIALPTPPAALTPEEKDAARLNPGLNRALYAMALGLRTEGTREWNYTTNLARPGGMGDRELLAAAQFACEREVWDRCINTSERTKAEFDVTQRFPMPFRDEVVRRSREIALDPAYVYGLIRQESRFIMDARSGVGASGLMQVMPATARWTARKIGLTGFTADQINDRDTNIAIGTGYLKLVLDDFNGSMPLAAAAYNAGPGRPRNWRNGPVVEAAIWAENVPFTETRDYVKKVLSNTTVYAAVISGQPQSLKARLGSVGPRDAALPEPNRDLP